MWDVLEITERIVDGVLVFEKLEHRVFTDRQKQNCLDAIPFFSRLGGSENWDGKRLESISPDGVIKITRMFERSKNEN
jgi:hypothetical protein